VGDVRPGAGPAHLSLRKRKIVSLGSKLGRVAGTEFALVVSIEWGVSVLLSRESHTQTRRVKLASVETAGQTTSRCIAIAVLT